jgi:hypothetical protein
MKVTVYLKATFKNRPKGYRGLVSTSYNFGTKVNLSYPALMKGIAMELAEFYYNVGLLDGSGVNQAVADAGAEIAALSGKFQEEAINDPSTH